MKLPKNLQTKKLAKNNQLVFNLINKQKGFSYKKKCENCEKTRLCASITSHHPKTTLYLCKPCYISIFCNSSNKMTKEELIKKYEQFLI